VKRKTAALIGDLAVEEPEEAEVENAAAHSAVRALKRGFAGGATPAEAASPSAAASVLAMLGGSDRELQEKALVTLLALLNGEATAPAAAAILQGASAASKIDSTLQLARSFQARAGVEDVESWEEVAVLAEQLALAVRNATAVDGSAVS